MTKNNKSRIKKIRNLDVGFSRSEITLAHKIYRDAGGIYARFGGFMNRGPERVADADQWAEVLFSIKPEAFYP